MAPTPTKYANHHWQVDPGTDFVHFCVKGSSENPVAWIDANGLPQGTLAVPTLSLVTTKTIYVDVNQTASAPNGTELAPFTSISAALTKVISNGDNATNPYVLRVAAGTYNETINLSNSALVNLTFVGYGAVVVGVPALQITNNDNLTDVSFFGFTFSTSGSNSVQISSTTNNTNLLSGANYGQGAAFYDCVFSTPGNTANFTVSNAGGFSFDRCSIAGQNFSFTNTSVAFFRGGSGLASGTSLSVSTVAGSQPNGFGGTTVQFRYTNCQAGITVGTGAFVYAYFGARLRNPITVNGTLYNAGSIITGTITVNSGGTYSEVYGGVHTSLSNSGTYSQGGTFGIGNIILSGANVSSGTGSPNGSVVGSPGDIYLNKSGGSATTLWVKESGTGTNTGWVGK